MNKLERYPQIINTQDLLKFFGLIVITLDHISTYFYYNPIFSVLGNFGAPIFFFLAGMHQAKRIFWGYLLAGSLVTLLTYLTQGYWFGNILLSFFIIKTILYYFPNLFSKSWSIILCLIPMFIHPFNAFVLGSTFFEFGGFGLSYAFSSFLRRTHKILGTISCILSLTGHYVWMHFFNRSSYELNFNYQTFSFDLKDWIDYWALGVFYAVYLCMLGVYVFFRMQTIQVQNPFLKKIILIFSRFSFELYTLQMILFRILAAALGTYGSFII